MRIVPISHLMPGMIVGKNIYNQHNSLLLSKGHILTEREIRRVIELKYQAIFISDSCFDDEILENTEDISDVLRNRAVTATKDLFFLISSKRTLNESDITKAKSSVDDIVNEIIMNRNATYSMTDLKLFDDYTYYHSVNVTVIAVIIGVSMNLNKASLCKLGLGALLHDIGKIFVPKDILGKEGKLTSEEFEIVKKHSMDGYEYLKNVKDFPGEANLAVRSHHEKFGGKGYPDGISGDKIPIFGRILTIADVFDALISDRPYRKALLPSDAVEYIIGNSGELFDPKIVDIFMEKVSPYPIGTYVMLSNGQKAIVVQNNPKFGLRPKVKVISDTEKALYYDLSKEFLDITITDIIFS